MELLEFIGALDAQNKTGRGFQIHLGAEEIDDKSVLKSVEFSNIFFKNTKIIRGGELLSFNNGDLNDEWESITHISSNNALFIDIQKIEYIEEEKNIEDWFEIPSEKVYHIYMSSEADHASAKRNALTIGFLGD